MCHGMQHTGLPQCCMHAWTMASSGQRRTPPHTHHLGADITLGGLVAVCHSHTVRPMRPLYQCQQAGKGMHHAMVAHLGAQSLSTQRHACTSSMLALAPCCCPSKHRQPTHPTRLFITHLQHAPPMGSACENCSAYSEPARQPTAPHQAKWRLHTCCPAENC
jgi:hypothetical protein